MASSSNNNIESLPNDCVSAILSRTSPQEACRVSLVSTTLRSIADSDLVWKSFLPSDYEDIVSRAVNPFTLKFSSYKQLFYALCRPLLLDGGNKSFKLDKSSGKKSYIISSRELSVAWSSDPLIWSWRPIAESRFAEATELRTVSWLEIEGRIRTRILTPKTSYAAYLIMNVSHRAYGLDSSPSEVSVAVGNKVHKGRAYVGHKDEKKRKMETLFYGNRTEILRNTVIQNKGVQVASKRDDGWMEIELGEFFSGEGDEEIKMSLREVGYQLKGGLVLEGIEVRPKTPCHGEIGKC
ncbi:F-box protein PP2-B15-like [Abrus precatorius]|uniref:F-box protein PP2-B15-like n=1 Tax=Abrus precatorius TaxID=3816 RepID=A0A8B8LBX7_ABRPR|nr:F-box protein PP2-B15-like [Abrus precatorius]